MLTHFFPPIILIIIASSVTSSVGKSSYARNGDAEDQPNCFNNLIIDLLNTSFSASSIWHNKFEFEAHQARMSSMIDVSTEHNGQAWCSSEFVTLQPTEWLEIDLGGLKILNSLFTMGRGEGNFKEYISFFYLEYLRENNQWFRYKNEHNIELLVGNGDARNVARTQFKCPVIARKIRIYPISKTSPTRACMRISIYGCNFDDGVTQYTMPQGHRYSMNGIEAYDFRDLAYDGRTSMVSSKLSGGLGRLMDNIMFESASGIEVNRGSYFVGWNRKVLRKNEVEIEFKFDHIRELKNIKIYTINVYSKNIGHFATAFVHFSVGGDIYDSISPPHIYQTILDRTENDSRWINIPLLNTLARFLKLKLQFEFDWIVLSEIIITSEKRDIILPIEKPFITAISTRSTVKRQKSTSHKKQIAILPVSQAPGNNIITKTASESRETSFIESSEIGFVITIASCLFAVLLLVTFFVFGFITIRSRRKRREKKSCYSHYPTRGNGSLFSGDAHVLPLTNATQSSSDAGTYCYTRPGGADLGISYPVVGKEYMTLSSRSGADYDMAGGNSLDGLITNARDGRHSVLNQHFPSLAYADHTYFPSGISRHSNESSVGSNHTEYATTSLYHFNAIMESNPNPASFPNHNLRQQPMGNAPTYNIQSPSPSMQIYAPSQVTDMFQQYYPFRHISNINRDSPTQFSLPVLPCSSPVHTLIPGKSYIQPESFPRCINLPVLKGLCGNSVPISIGAKSPNQSSASLANIITDLKELSPRDIETSTNIGQGVYGTIEFIRARESNAADINNKSVLQTYLSKCFMHYSTHDIRNEIIEEMNVQASIKHSAFLQLSSFTFDHQSAISIKPSKLCFLFKLEDQMENLYLLLQRHNDINPDNISHHGEKVRNQQAKSKKSSSSNVDKQYPNTASLLYICCQIAKGMSYLERHRIVHKDLAARNCLLGRDLVVKITDIALSMTTFKDHYIECNTLHVDPRDKALQNKSVIRQKYPLQWMASESILQGMYSTKTDVWSFGVTLWEILNRCKHPPFGDFCGVADLIIENAYLLSIGKSEAIFPSGIMPMRPWKANDHYFRSHELTENTSSILESNIGLTRDFVDLVRQCWNPNPNQRPSFANISLFLEQKKTNFDLDVVNSIS